MIPIPLPTSPLLTKIILFVVAVLVIASMFGLYNCNQNKKDKQQIEHNNKKRDEAVSEGKEKVKAYTDVKKLENQIPTKLKEADPVYHDKDCLKANKPPSDCEVAIERPPNAKHLSLIHI